VDQERKPGFTPGSMADGHWLLLLDSNKPISMYEFEFRSYTHLEDGKPKIVGRDPASIPRGIAFGI
jgi:hypothetical protein